MTDILSVTAPLLVNFANGNKCLVAEKYRHPEGLLVFEPFWMEDIGRCHLLPGNIQGDGPWKIGEHTVSILSCSEPELSLLWTQWDEYLAVHDDNAYRGLLLQTARSLGAMCLCEPLRRSFYKS